MIGTRIAHYEITAKLGEGGMGKVYRATDTKLNREVALKILPRQFASDAQRMGRFQREAEVLASLDHPNIGAIYGIEDAGETKALILQLIDGPTLADRIARGAIPVEEALPIAFQIAEALEAAHEKGIIHRDLKPANIKLAADGPVKVLDFGLAKAMGTDSTSPPDLTHSPTLSMSATREGVLLGTAAYMSPEQARGNPVDKRTDIWAFGCVLYEMLAGQAPFHGETVTDVLAAVVTEEPDWGQLPRGTPPNLVRLLRRCLSKGSARRLRDAGDAALELDERDEQSSPGSEMALATRRSPLWAAVTGVGLLLAGISVGAGLSYFWSSDAGARSSISLSLDYPEGQFRPEHLEVARISPNGEMFVVASRDQLYVRGLGDSQWSEIENARAASTWATEGIDHPFFSADSQWLGFRMGGRLMKVRIGSGAPPEPVAMAPGLIAGATWSREGIIVFGMPNQGLMKVPADGSADPEPLTQLSGERNELNHRWPHFLPDGKHVLFTIGRPDDNHIGLVDVETGSYSSLFPGWTPSYVDGGYVTYGLADALMVRPFDLDTLIAGEPAVAQRGVLSIVWGSTTNALYSVSRNGNLVFVVGAGPTSGASGRLALVRRGDGSAIPLGDPDGDPVYPRFTPDGRAVTAALQFGHRNIWRFELGDDDRRTRYPMDGNQFTHAHRGDGIFFFSSEGGGGGQTLFSRGITSGSEPSEAGYREEQIVAPGGFSADGDLLALTAIRAGTRGDIVLLPLDGGEPVTLGVPEDDERAPVLSRDGLLAYVSDREGQLEVFVERYPSSEGYKKASSGGGGEPVFSHDGKELFYRSGDAFYVVDIVATEPELELSPPRFLFRGPYEPTRVGTANYDVSSDGQLFVVVEMTERVLTNRTTVIVNWLKGVRPRVDTR